MADYAMLLRSFVVVPLPTVSSSISVEAGAATLEFAQSILEETKASVIICEESQTKMLLEAIEMCKKSYVKHIVQWRSSRHKGTVCDVIPPY